MKFYLADRLKGKVVLYQGSVESPAVITDLWTPHLLRAKTYDTLGEAKAAAETLGGWAVPSFIAKCLEITA